MNTATKNTVLPAVTADLLEKGGYLANNPVCSRIITAFYNSHFDHALGRSVMGQQILNLGLSCEHGYIPLDSKIFISEVKALGACPRMQIFVLKHQRF